MKIKSKCCGAGVKMTRHANADYEVEIYQCLRCGDECEVREVHQKLGATLVDVPRPKDFDPHTKEFWEELILGPVQFTLGEKPETVDSVLGVGDAPQHNED